MVVNAGVHRCAGTWPGAVIRYSQTTQVDSLSSYFTDQEWPGYSFGSSASLLYGTETWKLASEVARRHMSFGGGNKPSQRGPLTFPADVESFLKISDPRVAGASSPGLFWRIRNCSCNDAIPAVQGEEMQKVLDQLCNEDLDKIIPVDGAVPDNRYVPFLKRKHEPTSSEKQAIKT